MKIYSVRSFAVILAVLCLMTGCTKNKTYYWKLLTDVALFNEDNSGSVPKDAAGSSIPSACYAIRVQYRAVITGSDDGYDEKYDNHYVSSRSAAGILVYSLTDFDTKHPALSPLNDCFYSLNDTSTNYVDTSLYSALVANVHLTDLKSSKDTATGSSYLILMHPPTLPGPRMLIVNISFSDSTSSSDTISVNLL